MDSGLAFIRSCDITTNNVIDAMLSLLSSDLRKLMEASCIATVIEVDRVVMRKTGYDYSSACLETIFGVELTCKKSLQNTGLSITGFRILFDLFSNRGATSGELCDRLLLMKSAVSESLHGLLNDGLVMKGTNVQDKRSVRLYLTEQGNTICRKLITRIDKGLTKGIRKTAQQELSSWRELSTMFVGNYKKASGDWTVCGK